MNRLRFTLLASALLATPAFAADLAPQAAEPVAPVSNFTLEFTFEFTLGFPLHLF